jgi:hypothetical protein
MGTIETHTAGNVTSLRHGILTSQLCSTRCAVSLTMNAKATARLAGGRGNELLIQVYIYLVSDPGTPPFGKRTMTYPAGISQCTAIRWGIAHRHTIRPAGTGQNTLLLDVVSLRVSLIRTI